MFANGNGSMKKIVQVVLFLLLTAFVTKAQTVSRFDFDDPAFDERIATVGPNAVSSGAQANARALGNGTPQGCAAGVTPQFTGGCFTPGGCPQAVNMVVPGAVFNVTSPTMSIDYRRPRREIDGWFWLKDQLAFGVRFSKVTARYSHENGVGGCVPQIEFAAYPPAWNWPVNGGWLWGGAVPSNGELPVDGVWRNYAFSYNASTGVAMITITSASPAFTHTELNFGVAGMNFCGWSAANMTMFSNWDNYAAGFDLTASLDNASYGQMTVLPVLMEYFNGEQNGLGVDLHWKTASEQQNMGFILYRSTDADNWVEFARVDGNATTDESNTYSVRDVTPHRGLNFYRIVQVDMNGATTGYPAIKVNMNYAGENMLALFPNPVTEGSLKVKFDSEIENAPLQVKVLDLRGQLVHTQDFTMKSGINELDVDVTNLANGMYIAHVSNGMHTYSEKFSVLR